VVWGAELVGHTRCFSQQFSIGHWRGSSWCFNWYWQRILSAEAAELRNLLQQVQLWTVAADSFTWLPEVSKTFSVRSCYKMLSDLRTVEAAPNVFLVALNLLWLLIESRILNVAQSRKRDEGAERVNRVSWVQFRGIIVSKRTFSFFCDWHFFILLLLVIVLTKLCNTKKW
jgi:hypothetical protein